MLERDVATRIGWPTQAFRWLEWAVANASELIAQRELHHPLVGNRLAVLAERSSCVQRKCGGTARIKSHRVGRVKYFPAELQVVPFRQLPRLADTAIYAEIARPVN